MILEEYNEAVKNFSEATEYDSTGFGVVGKLKDAQDKAKKSKRKDYYKILGVEKGASDADIRKAYKKAALKWHPDKNNGSEESTEMFKKISEDYAILSNPDRRKKYDLYGDT